MCLQDTHECLYRRNQENLFKFMHKHTETLHSTFNYTTANDSQSNKFAFSTQSW